jgi:chemotaxis protein histidine kinase CheA
MQTTSHTIPLSLSHRYLLTSVAGQSLAFPAAWVIDILVVERSQVLALPFYQSRVWGVIHHQGKILPLVFAHPIFTEAKDLSWSQPTLMAVQLAPSLPSLAGVGIVIDRLVGSLKAEELTTERLFQLDDIPDSLWHPHRWQGN